MIGYYCHHQEYCNGTHWNEFYKDYNSETYLTVAVSDEGEFEIMFCDDDIENLTYELICKGQVKLS